MPHYEVVTPHDLRLIGEWKDGMNQLLENPGDTNSIRHRRLLDLGRPNANSNLDDVEKYVSRIRDFTTVSFGEQDGIRGGLDQMTTGLEALKVLGVSGPKQDPSRTNAWFAALQEVDYGVDKLHAASLETAPTFAKITDAHKVIHQMDRDVAKPDGLLVLERDGTPVAMASWRASSQGLVVDDLVASPAYIAAGDSGAGGVLMEHLVRKAMELAVPEVSLTPLNGRANVIYKKWHFQSDVPADPMSPMRLPQSAFSTFLDTHHTLGPRPSIGAAPVNLQPSTTVAATVSTVASLATASNKVPSITLPQGQPSISSLPQISPATQFGSPR